MKYFFAFCFALTINNGFAQPAVAVTIDATNAQTTISRHIYGHFAEHLGRCVYDGFWVADTLNVPKKDRIRLDIVEALKKIQVPNLRWPGGCFADEYHWRDGIGQRKQRPQMVNTNWGGVSEDNSFGTHEFLELCKLINCEPYIAGNVGSGTVEEMAKWVEYLNSDAKSTMTVLRGENGQQQPWRVKYWGVGNESWGCGGNMTPDYYADLYKRYATYARDYPGSQLYRIASGANSSDYNWTEVLMKKAARHMWGLTLHHYTVPTGNWGKKGSATAFSEAEYFNTMKNCLYMEELVSRHSTIMDQYDPSRRVALVVDEWGVWTDVEPGTNPGFLYQQNSLRDALIAGTTLNIFNNHSERVRMANLAQTINVLQSLILTKGNQLLLTPTYHVFELYKVHQDAKKLPVNFSSPDYLVEGKKLPAVNISASKDSTGNTHITLVNIDATKTITLRINLPATTWTTVQGRILTAPALTDVNTFENPGKVIIQKFSAAKKEGNELVVVLPAKSVVALQVR
ncbi:MAG: alpha-N-arabinofuranosidase [Chitinophagaceae bacterium]|nr:alpha-N-arabinofuranosidase [Chitinophagaceae bacterium]